MRTEGNITNVLFSIRHQQYDSLSRKSGKHFVLVLVQFIYNQPYLNHPRLKLRSLVATEQNSANVAQSEFRTIRTFTGRNEFRYITLTCDNRRSNCSDLTNADGLIIDNISTLIESPHDN